MFLGRKKEISELENLYKSNNFEMIAIYGRRRVGKSSLITYFAQNKPTIYFTARETDCARNLAIFSDALKTLFKTDD